MLRCLPKLGIVWFVFVALGCSSAAAPSAQEAPATSDATATSATAMVIEMYVPRTGWVQKPDAVLTEPVEAWRIPIGLTDTQGYTFGRANDLAVFERLGRVATLRLINPVDGSDHWSAEVPARGKVRVRFDAASTIVFVVGEASDGVEQVTIFDLETGAEIWTGEGDAVETAGDVLLVRGEEHTHGIDRATGEELWSTAMWSDSIFATVSEGQILVEDFADDAEFSLARVDPRTGDVLAHFDAPVAGDEEDILASVLAISGSDYQVIDDLLVFVNATDPENAQVSAYGIDDFALRWTAPIEDLAPLGARPFGDNALLVQSRYKVHVLDRETGVELWASLANVSDVVRVDGQVTAVLYRRDSTVVVDSQGATIAPVTNLSDDSFTLGQMTGGVIYRFSGEDAVAVSMWNEDVVWAIPELPGSRAFVPGAIDGGITMIVGDQIEGEAELIAFRAP